ncbi:MAG: DUF6364 family protein, partial [bacterium]
MQTKLTVRLEDELINRAKSVAEEQGKSLSKMVSDYFMALTNKEITGDNVELPPNVKSLYGALADSNVDES